MRCWRMSKEQELKEMLKLYSKQDLLNRIQEKQAMIYDLLYNQNQKAIEQLEKVRETINDKYQYLSKLEQQGELTYYGEGAKSLCYLLLKQIEQQINELKGNVEE